MSCFLERWLGEKNTARAFLLIKKDALKEFSQVIRGLGEFKPTQLGFIKENTIKIKEKGLENLNGITASTT